MSADAVLSIASEPAIPLQPTCELLSVRSLTKRYDDKTVVDAVNFQVGAGEIFGLLGPNGAGKSTTMMMIAGLLRPDGGEVDLAGSRFDPRDVKRRILLGVVPQELAIYPDLTADENLAFFGRLYGLRKATLRQRIDSALERVGLIERAQDRASTYSGGMKRRLNFAIALLHEPRLMILDEPTVGVDPQSRSHLLDCVRDLADEGIGVIYASHYMEEVQSICDRVAIMDHGVLLACDTVAGLLNQLSSDLVLRIDHPNPALVAKLREVSDVTIQQDEVDPNSKRIVISREANGDTQSLHDSLMKVTEILSDCEVQLRGIQTREPNLERLFLKMTGKRLRD